MSAIGSLIFCVDCGNLLNESTGDANTILTCDICGTKNRALDCASRTIVSESKPNAFPSALRAKSSAVRALTEEDRPANAVIQQTCPDCGRTEMRYYTLQLRSADEGSTVFYTCECGHKHNTNN
ncbi:DNA-directed RNA polymerase I subunit RPA12 [Microsporum canis CBS 113480]|uniref:DNA-directed RNA polymerase subunit n=1 Tax=Arthroderma otae (strain ATCC MYA-4605 / CBS 113480) TaxID=554155 RepID=C5FM14_ARTOC|nr:DNA-directed RNA polymerase I subunit RPA12 [Microsporum canis CBS 113480]EEQ30736.1 DNA-directed RNA polymerase I subunit RPA12 [Microsporum canis CBS 113480]